MASITFQSTVGIPALMKAIIALLMAFPIALGQSGKVRSWLSGDHFIAGHEPPSRAFGQMAELNGFLYIFSGSQGSGKQMLVYPRQ